MYYILGDIIKISKDFDVLVHGCNCFNTMNSGVAKQVRSAWPAAYEADNATEKGDKSKLGTLSTVEYEEIIVVNAYTQYEYGRNKKHADYDAIRRAMSLVSKHYGEDNAILMPRIGAGLAGGKWKDIRKIISKGLSGCDVTVCINDEVTFYNELAEVALTDQAKNIESYKKGAHSLMGVFVGKAMKYVRGEIDHVKLSNNVYKYIKDNYV